MYDSLLLNISRFCPKSYVYSFFLSLCLQLIFITTYWKEDTNVEEGGFCLFLWGLCLTLRCKQLKSQSHCFPESPEFSKSMTPQHYGTYKWRYSTGHYGSGILFLRYESSSLKLYKELSSSIFQSCQSVSLSGMRDTLPDLHFVQYIKA